MTSTHAPMFQYLSLLGGPITSLSAAVAFGPIEMRLRLTAMVRALAISRRHNHGDQWHLCLLPARGPVETAQCARLGSTTRPWPSHRGRGSFPTFIAVSLPFFPVEGPEVHLLGELSDALRLHARACSLVPRRLHTGTSFATALPRRVMTTSSPRSARSTSSDNLFFASKSPTSSMALIQLAEQLAYSEQAPTINWQLPKWRGPGGVPAEPPQHISRPVSRVL